MVDTAKFPSVNHFEAMDRALALAWRGWGRVAPNPLVGAVVLQGDLLVGEGWHAEYGGPHAEPIGPGRGRCSRSGCHHRCHAGAL